MAEKSDNSEGGLKDPSNEIKNTEGGPKDPNREIKWHSHEDGRKVLQMPKPFNIVLDVYGVLTPWSFATKTLPDFFYSHVKEYITETLTRKETYDTQKAKDRAEKEGKEHVGGLEGIAPKEVKQITRLQAVGRSTRVCLRILAKLRKDNQIEIDSGSNEPKVEPEGESIDKIAHSIESLVVWYRDNKKNTEAVDALRDQVWTWGYATEKLKVEIYEDAAWALEDWRGRQTIKIFVCSSGTPESIKDFLSTTSHGDLNKWVQNTLVGSSQAKRTVEHYKLLITCLRERLPGSMLWIADRPDEVRPARTAGLKGVLCMRPDGPQYGPEQIGDLHVIKSLRDIEFLDTGEGGPCC